MPSTRVETTLRIPEDLHRWFTQESHDRRVSLNALLLTALSGYRTAMQTIHAQQAGGRS